MTFLSNAPFVEPGKVANAAVQDHVQGATGGRHVISAKNGMGMRHSGLVRGWMAGAVMALSAVSPMEGMAAIRYQFLDLGTLGGPMSDATGINRQGLIVGSSCFNANCPYVTGAFLSTGQGMAMLPTLGGPGSTSANGLSSAGHVVGSSQAGPPGYGYHAYLFRYGVMIDLGTLGGAHSSAVAVNATGVVVGASDTPGGTTRAFLASVGASMSALEGIPDTWANSVATGINDRGVIIGTAYHTGYLNRRAFVLEGGVYTEIGTLGGTNSAAMAVNESGQVVGVASMEDDLAEQAFLYTDGALQGLGWLPGTSYSVGLGLNGRGDVVGYAWGATIGSRAFLYQDGEMLDLSALPEVTGAGWLGLTEARSINDSGWIVGAGLDARGQRRAFLLSPVPEPAGAALFLGGLAALLSSVRTRRRLLRRRCTHHPFAEGRSVVPIVPVWTVLP